MKLKKVLIYGGVAAGAYWLLARSRRAPMAKSSGLAGMGGAEDEWVNVYNSANVTHQKLLSDIGPLPDNLKSGYASILQTSSGSIAGQLQASYKFGTEKNFSPAMIYARAAIAALGRIAPLIAADVRDNTGAKSAAIIQQRLQAIATAQAANEEDRKLAEQGALAWLATKGGEAIGKGAAGVASGVGQGAWAFIKALPWWVYVLGLGGAAVYLGGHTMLMRKLSAVGSEPAKTNPRRRRK